MTRSVILTTLLVLGALFRLVTAEQGGGIATEFAHFAPFVSVFVCAAIFLRSAFTWWALIAIFLLTDLFIGISLNLGWMSLLDPGILVKYLIAAGVFLFFSGKKTSFGRSWKVITGVVTASCLFYLAANTVSWAAFPGYAKSFAGWWQANTVGLPGFPPTWVFFKNQIIGDLCFTALFLAALEFLPRRADAPIPSSVVVKN